MNQTTAFNPPFVCRLLDGTIVRFARSKMKHWAAIAEEMAQVERDAVLAEIDAEAAMKPVERAQARARANGLIVSIPTAIDRCQTTEPWITRHLTLAFTEAGGEADALPALLDLIPPVTQMDVAYQVAMLPVVKGDPLGTETNPLVPGVEFRPVASTGGESAPPSGDGTPDSTPAN